METNIQQKINMLENRLNQLEAQFFRGNFSVRQDFSKYSNFESRLKIPHYDTLPATCEVGEICESAGKLRICSAANTWTIVGTQS